MNKKAFGQLVTRDGIKITILANGEWEVVGPNGTLDPMGADAARDYCRSIPLSPAEGEPKAIYLEAMRRILGGGVVTIFDDEPTPEGDVY